MNAGKKIRTSASRKLFCVANYLLLALLGLICVLPVWHVVCASLSDPMELAINKDVYKRQQDGQTASSPTYRAVSGRSSAPHWVQMIWLIFPAPFCF